MKIFVSKIIATSLLVIISLAGIKAQTASINLGTQRQTITGFGGMNFPRWISDLTAAQTDRAFGNGPGQLGLSILRISVSPTSSQWALELPTAQRAKSHGAIIFATPWSPPASMKTNNSTIKGELRTDAYDDYAAYLTQFSNYMASNGAALHAISVQNEPDWLPDYESCGWNYTQMYNFVKNYAGTIPTKVIAAEALGFNKAYTDPILNDAAARANIDIVGGHLYGSSPSDYPLARNNGKEIWMTEHYTSSNVDANSWPDALGVGTEIHNCMINYFNAYIWWYIRRSYGPLDENGNITKRGHVMSHFSKFVRPGFKRVDATATPAANVSVTAYTDGNTLVIVAINRNSASSTVNFNLTGGQVGNVTKYETTSSNNLANLGTVNAGSSLTNTLAGNSITTFVGTLGNTAGTETVSLEAECGTVGALWNTVSDPNASNDRYVAIAAGNTSTTSAPTGTNGQITYAFNVNQGGNYSLWARLITPNADDDSFWISMDGGAWYAWNNIGPYNTWTWAQSQSYPLTAGAHTLRIAYREDGAQLDKIILSNTGATPTGEGTAAANCQSAGRNIVVRALGAGASEQITLSVGGTPVQSWTLSNTMASYAATTTLPGPITVAFTNDDGSVRDVQIDYIQVNGVTLQAEDQSVNTGVWQNSACGGQNSEWLHCNGYIQFETSSTTRMAYNDTHVSEYSTREDIEVYPIPANNILHISVPAAADKATMSIHNAKGDVVKTMSLRKAENDLDVTDLPPGLYILRIVNGSETIVSKIIKN